MSSMINRALSRCSDNPELGGGATVLHWSDRFPATVIAIITYKSGPRKGLPKEVIVQHDTAVIVSGEEYDGSAQYEYHRDEDGTMIAFTVRKDGKWRQKNNYSPVVIFGTRDRYHDPHF